MTADDGGSYNIYYNDDGITWSFEDHPDNAYPPRLEARRNGEDTLLKRRPDDANAHAVIKRIDTYLESTSPLVDYYRQKALLVTINADQSIEAVRADIKQAIDKTS